MIPQGWTGTGIRLHSDSLNGGALLTKAMLDFVTLIYMICLTRSIKLKARILPVG